MNKKFVWFHLHLFKKVWLYYTWLTLEDNFSHARARFSHSLLRQRKSFWGHMWSVDHVLCSPVLVTCLRALKVMIFLFHSRVMQNHGWGGSLDNDGSGDCVCVLYYDIYSDENCYHTFSAYFYCIYFSPFNIFYLSFWNRVGKCNVKRLRL
jgi:hypothetical protein